MIGRPPPQQGYVIMQPIPSICVYEDCRKPFMRHTPKQVACDGCHSRFDRDKQERKKLRERERRRKQYAAERGGKVRDWSKQQVAPVGP